MTRTLGVCLVVLLWIAQGPTRAAGGARLQSAGAGPVVGMTALVHGVESLNETLPYYRLALGLDVIGSVPEKPIYDVRIQTLLNHGGAYYRMATLKLPDAGFNLQLLEIVNGREGTQKSDRQASARPTDRGSAMLTIHPPDLAGIFARIQQTFQSDVVTTGGQPVGRERPMVVIRNRDGFVTAFAGRDPVGGSEGGNANAAAIALTTGNAAAKIKFYRDVLGFELTTGDWDGNPELLQALGAPSGVMRRRTQGFIPGTRTPFAIDEYRGLPPQRRAYYFYNSIPGAVTLQLLVRDMDAMMKVLLAERVRILSTGLEPVTLDESRNVLIRDPEGLFIELIERPSRSNP